MLLRMPRAHMSRVDAWALVAPYGLPASELRRMGGTLEAEHLVRNHISPRETVSVACVRRLLGEIELDRTHPMWGVHRAALAGVPDAELQPEYDAARNERMADDMHAAAVAKLGARLLDAARRPVCYSSSSTTPRRGSDCDDVPPTSGNQAGRMCLRSIDMKRPT